MVHAVGLYLVHAHPGSVDKAAPRAYLSRQRAHGARRLPSFNAEFTASTPLTRIRDIAHRSDIPHDLKQEIKHTIQVRTGRALPITWHAR